MPPRSIVSNRNKLRKAREALRALPPERREELRFNNIGPGDSYVGIWRVVNVYRRRFNDVEIALRQSGLSRPKSTIFARNGASCWSKSSDAIRRSYPSRGPS